MTNTRTYRAILRIAVVAIVLAVALQSPSSAQPDAVSQPGPEGTTSPHWKYSERDDPALFDLNLALRNRSEILAQMAEIDGLVQQSLDAAEGLRLEREFMDLSDSARAAALQEAKSEARATALLAYMGVGEPISDLTLFDAETAADLTYRHGLLRQRNKQQTETARNYEILFGEAKTEVRQLSRDLDDVLRMIEGHRQRLLQLRERLDYAEWAVSIARIHKEGNEAFALSGRAEPAEEQWNRLRHCESTNRYWIDSGNSFYGAYQFTWDTWGTVGGTDNAAHDAPAEQDARARLLYARRGSQPWPVCGRYLP